ncbi:hypothetical protein SH668x_001969 [Planctomicrobium sp. SH668]|uniref:hypothetical protein n=1 Tax=Planctomicrobium sp. SH668 TaxID=3448126 RepID=UPI003F5AFCC0
MQPYSKEFRREVLSVCDAGGVTGEVVLRFDVSESWERRIKQERHEQGKTAPLIKRNRIPRWMAEQQQIEDAIRPQPDLTSINGGLSGSCCSQGETLTRW